MMVSRDAYGRDWDACIAKTKQKQIKCSSSTRKNKTAAIIVICTFSTVEYVCAELSGELE